MTSSSDAPPSPEPPARSDNEILCTVDVEVSLFIYPVFLTNPIGGVREVFNQLLFKYVKELQGSLVAYWNLQLLDRPSFVLDQVPYVPVYVTATFLVFRPRAGARIVGEVTGTGEQHVALLVKGCFNAVAEDMDARFQARADAETGFVEFFGRDDAAECITDGAFVRFEVLSVRSRKNIIQIDAGLTSLGTGPILHAEDAAPSDEEEPTDGLDAAAHASSQSESMADAAPAEQVDAEDDWDWE